jgi:hypothetical protein
MAKSSGIIYFFRQSLWVLFTIQKENQIAFEVFFFLSEKPFFDDPEVFSIDHLRLKKE